MNINENVKAIVQKSKKALSNAFSHTIDDTIATELGGVGVGS